MRRLNGSSARKLDFGDMTTTAFGTSRGFLRLAAPSGVPRGTDKYKVLDERRRRAQIRARRFLALLEGE